MPSTPSTPAAPHRRRSVGIRRPRVAGQAPPGRDDIRQDEVPAGRVGLLKRTVRAPEDPETAGTPDETADDALAGEAPTGRRGLRARLRRPRTGKRTRRAVPTLVLVGLLVVLTAAAVFFGIAGAALRGTPAARNTALVDVGTTAQVTQQLGDAVKTVYSYDFARLNQNEAAARAVILPGFEAQYNQLFGQVRTIAPQQQAVVTATVATSAVREIDGDRAIVVIFLDQQVTRAQAGQPQQLAAAGRLTVTGRFVGGTWKIENVQAD